MHFKGGAGDESVICGVLVVSSSLGAEQCGEACSDGEAQSAGREASGGRNGGKGDCVVLDVTRRAGGACGRRGTCIYAVSRSRRWAMMRAPFRCRATLQPNTGTTNFASQATTPASHTAVCAPHHHELAILVAFAAQSGAHRRCLPSAASTCQPVSHVRCACPACPRGLVFPTHAAHAPRASPAPGDAIARRRAEPRTAREPCRSLRTPSSGPLPVLAD